MKFNAGDTEVILGKRVSIGAGINGTAAVLAHIYPDHAPAIISAAVPLTMVTQVLIARYWGVTT
jgi:hypothetical protein